MAMPTINLEGYVTERSNQSSSIAHFCNICTYLLISLGFCGLSQRSRKLGIIATIGQLWC
jgi:hypothetical protein